MISDDIEAPRPAYTPSPEVESVEHSPEYERVAALLREAVENEGGGAVKVKVGERLKPLSQFLASDLYKHDLRPDEIAAILQEHLPETQADPAYGVPETYRRALGRHATSGIGKPRFFDYKELQSGLHKES